MAIDPAFATPFAAAADVPPLGPAPPPPPPPPAEVEGPAPLPDAPPPLPPAPAAPLAPRPLNVSAVAGKCIRTSAMSAVGYKSCLTC